MRMLKNAEAFEERGAARENHFNLQSLLVFFSPAAAAEKRDVRANLIFFPEGGAELVGALFFWGGPSGPQDGKHLLARDREGGSRENDPGWVDRDFPRPLHTPFPAFVFTSRFTSPVTGTANQTLLSSKVQDGRSRGVNGTTGKSCPGR